MKKIALLLLSVLTLSMLLFGCEYNREQSLDESDFSIFESSNGIVSTKSSNDTVSAKSSNDTVSAESTESTDFNKTRIKELETQIKNLRTELSEANSEKVALLKQISDLEDKVEALEKQYTKKIWINGGYMTLVEKFIPRSYKLSAYYYNDNAVVEVIELNYIWTIKVSPNNTKVILNNFEFEYNANVWLYDVEKRKTRELSITNIPAHTTVANMEWLDDRYFLFIVQFDSGTIVRGGDVYIYDTKTDQYKAIIINKDNKFQTSDFDVFKDDFVLFSSWLFDEAFSDADRKYHLLTHAEIYDLIKNNKTIDLSNTKGLSK